MSGSSQPPQTIALTGATGFVGQHTLKLLLERGHSVRALYQQSQQKKHPNLTWVPGSLQNQNSLEELVSGADSVIHIAGVIKASSCAAFFEANEQGTANLVEAMSQVDRPPHLLHLSSLAAREPHLSAYAASKQAAEIVAQSYQDGEDTVVLRPSAVYGPGDMETLFYFKSASAAFATVPGKSTHRTSLSMYRTWQMLWFHSLNNVSAKRNRCRLMMARKAVMPWRRSLISLDQADAERPTPYIFLS